MAQQDSSAAISMGKDQQQPPAPAYRGAMVQNRAAQDNFVDTGAQKAGKSAASTQSTQFGGKADNVMRLQPDTAPNSKGAQKIEIQVIGGDVAAPVAAKVNINEVSHTTIPSASPQEVVSKLTSTIGAFSDATYTTIDETGLSISGSAFVGDYHAVHFKIDVTADDEGNAHFEFLRTSGSALAAAKFLGIVNQTFKAKAVKKHQKRSSSGNLMVDAVVNAVHEAMEAAEQASLVALDINADDLELKMDEAAQEKMYVMDALHADDAVPVEMDGASEVYLTQKLVEAGAIGKDNTLDKAKLVEALVEEEVLGNKDVAVVRAASLILSQLVKECSAQMVKGDTFEAVAGAVGQAECGVLARRYLVSLLSALATAKEEWQVAEQNKAALVAAVKAVQAELEKTKGVAFKESEFKGVDCEAVLAKLNA